MYIFSITGFVGDGEFNFLRAKGYTRPLSVLQVHSNVQNLYSKGDKNDYDVITSNSASRLHNAAYIVNNYYTDKQHWS